MQAAIALAGRTRGGTAPNPNVGCVIVAEGRVVGRGWTQAGGRPHAEAMALAQAGDAARGATAYVTLEPCAHLSPRGSACSDLLVAAGVTRVVAGIEDPDPRTAGAGFARLRAAGIAVEVGVEAVAARASMAGFLTRRAHGRPFVTLKLATSLDGCIALADGTSRWITGPEARAHAHLERSRHEAILVGRGTWDADAPALDVRLPGLEGRSPVRVVLSATGAGALRGSDLCLGDDREDPVPGSAAPPRPRRPGEGRGLDEVGAMQVAGPAGGRGGPSLRWGDVSRYAGNGDGDVGDRTDMTKAPQDVLVLSSPAAIATLPGDHLLVEGGAGAAGAFLRAGLVDRLLLYRAPILIGGGLAALGDIGLGSLAEAHGRWRLTDARRLGSDRIEVYERPPCSPGSSPT